jgi:D-amino peptidase
MEAGADEVLVNEAHDGMKNILLEELDPRAEIIIGRRKPYVMMEGVEGADVAFFVGYHTGAGTGGVLSHTFRATPIIGVELNGEPCSEGRMNATFAGLQNIPVGLVSGDNMVCEEAKVLYGSVRTAQVKIAIDRYTARCLVPEVAHDLIQGEAKAAVEEVERLIPYIVEPPYTFTVEFATASLAASTLYFPEIERLDDRRISWSHEDYAVAYKMFIGVMALANADPDFG